MRAAAEAAGRVDYSTPEMRAVSAELYQRCTDAVCFCGAEKSLFGYVFCTACRERLFKANLSLGWAERERRSYHGSGGVTPMFFYDTCCDALAAMRSGRWNGKPLRRAGEDEGAR